MSPHDDVELLNSWRQHGDRQAIDQLVRRHIHFVYASARRQVADPHLAEDVTQAVFMLLVTKSPRLPSPAALSVWLHNATRYASANARRMRVRRDHRERQAARLAAVEEQNCSGDFAELAPMLDQAIGWLPRRDREGVILCFFEGRSYSQIGSALGVSEEAARKRVSRAIGRMRDFFASRGVVTTGAAIAACIASESAAAAPPALVAASVNLATVSHLAGAAGSTLIAKGALHAMLVAKIKLAAAACAAVVVGGTLTAAAIQQVIAPPTAIVSTTTLLADPFKVRASDSTEVTFLGIAKWDAGAKGWYAIDGTKIDDPRGPFADEQLRARPQTTHQAMLHISGQQLGGGYAVDIPQAAAPPQLYDLTPSPDEAFLLIPFEVPTNQKTVDIALRLADGDWKTLVTVEHQPGRPLGGHDTDYGGIVFTHVIDAPDGGSMVYVAHDIKGPQFEVFATDAQGTEHRAHNINGGTVGSFAAYRYDFNIPTDSITTLAAKVRPFSRRVTAKNVSVDPAHATQPQIVSETIENPPKK
jgi:RNA polymerase sigma factor (sigma-70 family)